MKKATPAQLAARAKFAEMARSGALAKKRLATAKKKPAKKTVSQKISQLRHEGYPQKQAVAVALSEKRAGRVKNPIKTIDEKIDYAVQRKKETKQNYMVSDMGHVLLDNAHNRKAFKEMEVGVVFETKRKTNPAPKKIAVKKMHMYTVHRCDANGNPVYHIAHFRNLKDAKEYSQACADAHGKMYCITKKAI